MTKPGQNASILPERAERRRIQALHGLKQFRSDLAGIAAKRRTYPLHRSEQIHDERHRGALGPLEQECRTAFAQNPLGDLSRFEHRIDFDAHSLELPCCFEMRHKRLQIVQKA